MSTLTADSTATRAGQPVLAGKDLTVALENDAYGIAVLKDREIIRCQKITPVRRCRAT